MQIEPSSKVFVTGGNGFIGSNLVHVLIEAGYSVRCLLRKSSNTERIAHLDFETVQGDLLEPASLLEGMQGCHAVVHLAAIANWANINSPQMRKVVVEGTENILKAAQTRGNLTTVYVSSSSAINGSLQPQTFDESSAFELPSKGFAYACAKHEAEGVCKKYHQANLPVVIVNPTEVYGPNDKDLVTANTLITFANSATAMVTRGGTSIVHVEDVALGIIAALKKGIPGERYILGSDNLSFEALAKLTLDLLGQDKKIATIPTPLIHFLSWLEGTFKLKLGADPALMPYATRYWFMDTSKAKQELGTQFRSPKEILEPTLKWLQENNYIQTQTNLSESEQPAQ